MTWLGRYKDDPKPFLSHLEDLRRAILRVLAALGVGVALAWPLAPHVLRWLQRPLAAAAGAPPVRVLDVAGGLGVAVQTIVWTGLLLASPAIAFFVADFIFPGLTLRERRVTCAAIGTAIALFAVGVVTCYLLALPMALVALCRVNAWVGVRAEFWTLHSYVTFALGFLAAFGVAFELPVIVFALGRLGVVSSSMLREKRRHVIVILLVVAMVLTPPDVVSQILLAIPLYLLYEVSVWVLRAMGS